MKLKSPIESLLRPPVEWWSSAVSLGAGITLLEWPQAFVLSPAAAATLAGGCGALALRRFWQGYRVVRYQRHLRKLPLYTLSSKQIPVSRKKLFLGKGFRWQPIHTQRLYDLQQPKAAQYVRPRALYRLARRLEQRWENKSYLSPLAKLLSSQTKWNFVRPLPELGGSPLLHGVEPKQQNVWMNLSERVGHMLVLGATRVGKTRLLELLVTQDIQRGDSVIIFDPKGDGQLLRRIYFEAMLAGRLDDLIIFHLGFPEISARYNPIGQFARITEVANRLANQLPSEGEAAAFKDFAWHFINIIAKALVALGKRPDYQQIQRYILNIDPLLLEYCQHYLPQRDPAWEQAVQEILKFIDDDQLLPHLKTRPRYLIALARYLQQHPLNDPIIEGLCSVFNYDKTYYDKITASLLPLLGKLTTGRVADLISPNYEDLDDNRPIFDWLQVIRGKKIVYIGLDALSDATIASAVGSSMFSDIASTTGQIYKFGVENTETEITYLSETDKKTQYRIAIHGDEFNELANDDLTNLLNKGGGAGLQLTLYTQTWADVEARLGSEAKAGKVAGNLNTLIVMRVLDEKTARFLTDKLPQNVTIHTLQPVSSVSDTPQASSETDFVTSNSDRIVTLQVPMLTPGDLIQLPKGQAFILIEGGQLWQLRIPLPEDDIQGLPEEIDDLAIHMQQQYEQHFKAV